MSLRKPLALLTLVLLALLSSFGAGIVRGNDPVPQRVKEPRELFDGKSLDGWYSYLNKRGVNDDPNGVFTVTDGMIRISGEDWGCITTNEAFCDYKIIVEFKWGEKRWGSREATTRDSGLLIHSLGEDGAFGKTWMYSIEANIIEGGLGDFIVVGDGTDRFSLTAESAPEKSTADCFIWQKGGKPQTVHEGRIDWFGRDPAWTDTADFRGKDDLDAPLGGWNRLELVADGDRIDVYVNGTLVNQAIHVSPTGGKIQIQSEGAEIFIRRIALVPIK